MAVILEAKNIQKEFGDNLVLSDLDLEVEEKEIHGIIGLNGSGKTTLLRILVGFYKADEGHVFFKGRDIKKQNIKRSFGFATQDNCFYDNLTVEENLRYFGGLYGLTKEFLAKNVKEILELVELYDARGTLAGNLSTGMQRRLDIACAIIHKPEVLILDEPTEDLDPKLRIQMLQLIKRINKEGTTIVMTSHLLWEVERLCDKIAILHNRKIISSGSAKEIKDRYSKDEEIHLETASADYDKIIKKLDKKEIRKVVKKGRRIVIYSPKAEIVLHKILHLIEQMKEKLMDINVRKPDLNEVFESLTRKDK